MADKRQRLVLSILDFLSESMQDGTVKEEDKEGIEVAAQTIGEAFGIDPTNDQQRERLTVKPANLLTIFDVYLKTRDKVSAESAPSKVSSKSQVPEADKAKAEQHKLTGNSQMSKKEYAAAIAAYTEAIALDPTNPVYYSNRAAAHSSTNDHANAVADAEKALECDPKFVKAYSRLGHAHYSLGDYTSASTAFSRGLELDPNNTNLKAGLDQAEARISAAAQVTQNPEETPLTSQPTPDGDGGIPDLSSLLGGLGGMGGGGDGGGLAGMMNNPAVMQMAQNLMGNGGLERLMQNPAFANLMNRTRSGGEMPSMQEIMNDPGLRDLAGSFMGGAGAGAGRGSSA